MKRTFFKFSFVLSITTIILSCSENTIELSENYDGSIVLKTQEEIDAFPFKSISGDLTISFVENITNLKGLDGLTSIGGNLRIFGNESLTSLSGLENLTSVGYRIEIFHNPSLSSLQALENISKISADLYIGDNKVLNSLSGLENITSVNGYVIVINNDNLISLNGLDGLTTIGNYFWITENDALISLSGLENLTTISSNWNRSNKSHTSLVKKSFNNTDWVKIPSASQRIILTQNGFFSISNNPALKSLAGLNKLSSIGGTLYIERNESLESLAGLESLVDIKKNVSIGKDSFAKFPPPSQGNSSLTDFCGIQHLIQNGQITKNEYFVDNNAYNPSYEEMQSTADICTQSNVFPGNLTLASQTQIDAFNYTTIKGSLTIRDGENNITNLNNLKGLVSVGGGLIIDQNPNLISLNGLENLTIVKENLIISNNTSLTSLSGLDNILTINGCLYLVDNTSLTSLMGLSKLTTINDFFRIEGNNKLSSLNGLNNLNSINDDLSIYENELLTSLDGLDNLGTISRNLNIFYNDVLTDFCSIRQLIIDGEITVNEYNVDDNAYNPSFTDIQKLDNGGCKN